MTTGNPERRPYDLTAQQASVLEGFVEHFMDDSNRTVTHVGYYDLVSANLRDALRKFELPMETLEEYFPVMAGISIATEWIKGLTEKGLSLEQAIEVIQDGFARLAPEGCIPSGDA